MPSKIPFTSLVLTGHRGTWLTKRQDNPVVKALTGQPKETWATEHAAHPYLLPRPKPRGALPAFSIKRITDFTRFTDKQSLAKAAKQSALELGTPDEVVQAVTAHVRARLQALGMSDDQSPAPLILVGEGHESRTSFVVNLATIACVTDRNATVLLELPRSEVDNVVRQADVLDRLLNTNPIAAIQRVQSALGSETERETMFTILTAYMARKAGACVEPFDSGYRTASHKAEREASMEAAIRDCLDTAQGPVVVITGSNHLPHIHDHVEGLIDAVALTTIIGAQVKPPSAEHRKRSSYLFANDDILKVKATRQLETQPFEALTFIGSLVDLAPTTRRPGSPVAYGMPGPSGSSSG